METRSRPDHDQDRYSFSLLPHRLASGIRGELSPPGFGGAISSAHTDSTSRGEQREQQQHLLSKRAWDLALQPVKSLPMNVFMMYMAGSTISIFPIMMVAMMAWRPVKAFMTLQACPFLIH
jgi:hypothetical protein